MGLGEVNGYVPLCQDVIIITDQGASGSGAERRKLAIVRIHNARECFRGRHALELALRLKKVHDSSPVKVRDAAQNHPRLPAVRLVPTQPISPFSDSLNEARGS